MTSNREKIFDLLKLMSEVIAATFGDKCEVVVHNFSNIEQSIVHISNGHVTGRNVGDTLTDLGLQYISNNPTEKSLINYRTKTNDGRTLRSSSVIVHDEEGKPLASLCINHDITDLITFSHTLEKMITFEEEQPGEETFTTNVNNLLDHLLDEAVRLVGKPVHLMNKEDKLKAIKFLDDKGCFSIKKAIERVAGYFDVSRFTIYNYIDEIRNHDKQIFSGKIY